MKQPWEDKKENISKKKTVEFTKTFREMGKRKKKYSKNIV